MTDDDRHFHDLTPEAIREQFGEDATAGLDFTDLGPPAANSTAVRMVKDRDKARRQIQLQRQRKRRDLLRDKEKDHQAYQKVMVEGIDGTSQEQARADRYARENGLHVARSSAEILAEQVS
jgi:hypothetical protein